ncbi:hypothetical protein AN958_02478 [Leucoagaricus sp. SymC.cos]|nr:hypothetical protein AN958_02478 [Leucoagaricus sp. SymC.cos]
MVFAVARTTARKAANVVSHRGHHGPGQSAAHGFQTGAPIRHASTTARASHFLGPFPPKPPRNPPNKLFTHYRNFFTRIFNRLATPGVRVPTCLHNTGAGSSRSLHAGAGPTIQSGLSFHARTALSSGSRPFLPRPPSPGVRVATNVGLGTARNFSTARPIFQNLVENVPVVARVFYEADLDLKLGRVQRPRSRRAKSSTHTKTKKPLQPRDAPIPVTPADDLEADITHYFDDVVPPVTTVLFVPLAPTPSSRVPLPPEPILPNDSPALLPPLSFFGPYHASHENHRAMVSSLFSRLEHADVWFRGAKCSAYGQGADGTGICTVLKVEFTGWTEAEVRAVIGESGTGWCSLREYRVEDDAEGMSELSSVIDLAEEGVLRNDNHTDVSSSFVMPTLDITCSGHHVSLSPSPSMESLSLPSSTFSSRPMSTVSDISGFEDPWRDDGSDAQRLAGTQSYMSVNRSERSSQRLGALEFSPRHMNQRD